LWYDGNRGKQQKGYKMIRAHKIRIFQKKAQETGLKKACGCAGFLKEHSLCENCLFEIERDLNAAVNLEKLGACCPETKPVDSALDFGKTKQRKLKQELTVNDCHQSLIER
jgi:transposase